MEESIHPKASPASSENPENGVKLTNLEGHQSSTQRPMNKSQVALKAVAEELVTLLWTKNSNKNRTSSPTEAEVRKELLKLGVTKTSVSILTEQHLLNDIDGGLLPKSTKKKKRWYQWGHHLSI
jgi:hypothetical protein